MVRRLSLLSCLLLGFLSILSCTAPGAWASRPASPATRSVTRTTLPRTLLGNWNAWSPGLDVSRGIAYLNPTGQTMATSGSISRFTFSASGHYTWAKLV